MSQTIRQLKFQAYDEQTGQMSEPFSLGDIGEMDEGVTGILMPDNRWYRLDRLKIRQFTGLTDKNGVEIYEGDILRLAYPRIYLDGEGYKEWVTVRIEFQNGGFWFTGSGVTDCNWHHYDRADREVIGNIYQHPTLIEEKAE